MCCIVPQIVRELLKITKLQKLNEMDPSIPPFMQHDGQLVDSVTMDVVAWMNYFFEEATQHQPNKSYSLLPDNMLFQRGGLENE